MPIEKMELKEVYLPRVKEDLKNSQEEFPSFLQEISDVSKRKNEEYIKKQQEKFSKVWQEGELKKDELDKAISDALKDEEIFGLNSIMDKQTLADTDKAIKTFFRKARSFAPDMGMSDMGKATRNYIAYSVFNMMNDQKQECTDGIFAYSMLYPVTDNLLDDPIISLKEKKQYNKFIKDTLLGLSPKAHTKEQARTQELLQMIEKEYSRNSHKDIYTILLCMLEAQEHSMLQQKSTEPLTNTELLDISAYKGGMSVLADRYFVKKEISNKDIYFYLAFGLVLQLADDLQDITEDLKKTSQTLPIAQSVDKELLEKGINKQLHFAKQTVYSSDISKTKFKEVLANSCYMLILFSAYESRAFISDEYIEKLERYLPVSYAFIREQKHNIGLQNKPSDNEYMEIIDKML